jgi:hypothetical protein
LETPVIPGRVANTVRTPLTSDIKGISINLREYHGQREGMLKADLQGASRKSNSSRDAGGSRASNRRDAINSRLTRCITEK